MLSLAKLAGADQRYFLDQAQTRTDHAGSVSSGAEDYYLSGPEANGHWTGSGAAALGVEGDVSEAQLRAVLSRRHPTTGRRLEGSVQRARVPGFDLMFSVPKSASVLFGIGHHDIQRAVLAAQAAAVDSALAYLERQACRTRRGAGGYEIVPGDGFVGAAFRHRTSRAGDPQIHTHVLIANATRIGDGTWGSLDGRAIYAEARTAGFIHEAVFRRELSRRLGVSWTKARNGIAEIEGVPRPVIDAFSRRRAEIDAQVEAWGRDTAAARQSAAVQTRKRKDYGVTPEKLAPEWRRRAAGLELDAERVADIIGRRLDRDSLDDALAERLRSSEGLTALRSSFDRRDVVRAIAEAAIDGASLEQIDAFVATVLADPEVVTLAEPGGSVRREDVIRLRDGRLIRAMASNPMYSTAELLSVEQRLVDGVVAARDVGVGVADSDTVEAVLARRPSIGSDQALMVRRLCTDGSGVQLVVGPPGTGKTFALSAAREAWAASGFTVVGAAVARRAAVELSAASGMDATSVAALLAELRQGVAPVLDARTILVIDEAAMLATRPLAEIAEHSRRAGAKLVLVGDPEQLPEIGAGGAFRALCASTDPIGLTENRRQRRQADRALLAHWRAGDLPAALTIATASGDLVLDVSPEEAVTRMVADYCAFLAGGGDAVMLAPRRAEVRMLNRLARHALSDAGSIAGPSLQVGDVAFARGDRVVLRLNAPELRVQNGTRGAVVAVDQAQHALTIALADGTQRTLPSRYVHLRTPRGTPAVEHGYALTAHLAQGMTTDQVFILGSETVYREWGYTAWSRARERTRFYAVEPEISDEHHTAAPVGVDRFDELARRLDRTGAQQFGLDSLPHPIADRRAAGAKHAREAYLESALGPRPEQISRRRAWDRAARHIERYRARHGITDTSDALGPQPGAPLDRIAWRRAQRLIARQRSVSEERRQGREIGL